ncbi:hypothetical protein NSQ29_01065 [Paenibacillus sp. FSL F4-0236]|uniref:hypothetical protein n=1 Tax=Paenibacillus sp. FSL F4-0236 TaxID=2954731 RepID=UPI0030F8EE12
MGGGTQGKCLACREGGKLSEWRGILRSRLPPIWPTEQKEGYKSRKLPRFEPDPPNERYKSRRLSQSAILPILLKAQTALLAVSIHQTEPSQTIIKQAGE